MAVNFLLKRTSSGDKRPTAAQLDVGELGLNYEAGDPGLFFEDSNGVVRKVGPCTVGGTAPNTNPAGSTGNSTGELWLDNSGGDNVLKIYDGTSWQTAASDNVSTATELSGPVVFTAQAGVALTFGEVVYISGAAGDTPIVSKAQANSSTTMPAYGFAGEDIASGATGKIVTFGSIEGDGSTPLDTSTLTVNDVVYVSESTAGGWTTTKPTGEGNLLQNIGRIQRINSQNGVIKVGGAGRSNAVPNLNEGNIFIGDSSNESSTSSLTSALSTHAGISSSADAVALTIDSSENVSITGSLSIGNDILLSDNLGDSLDIREGSNVYMRFVTTDAAEKIQVIEDLFCQSDLSVNGNILADSQGEVRFAELLANGSNYTALRAPAALTATTTLTLPDGDGSADQSLRTDGSGTLSWKNTPTALFGINAHAAWDASAGSSFDWSTDKINEGNITSVTRTATGKFTVTFDTDFSSANYTAVCTAGGLDHSGITAGGRTVSVLSRSAGSMDIVVERADDAANDDCEYISIMVIGTLS